MNARVLSAAELAIAPAAVHPMREHHETWLYFHLVQAAKARRDLERAQTFTEYEEARIARKQSISRANEHYRALLAFGPHIEPLLAQMTMTEGLTP
jgi:hypothetical protein